MSYPILKIRSPNHDMIISYLFLIIILIFEAQILYLNSKYSLSLKKIFCDDGKFIIKLFPNCQLLNYHRDLRENHFSLITTLDDCKMLNFFNYHNRSDSLFLDKRFLIYLEFHSLYNFKY